MSIKSKLSRNLSIKSRVNTLVRYGGQGSVKGLGDSAGHRTSAAVDDKQGKADAMQRVAVTLR